MYKFLCIRKNVTLWTLVFLLLLRDQDPGLEQEQVMERQWQLKLLRSETFAFAKVRHLLHTMTSREWIG